MRQRRVFSLIFMVAMCATAGCGGGSSDSSAVPPTSLPPTPVSGLLSDAQLRTAADPAAAFVTGESASWFADNVSVVRSLTEDDDFSDLEFLGPLIDGKRIVSLGESSHGVEEYSQAKLRLIKYLHEVQGFNVLAFEGGLFDCERAQVFLESDLARNAMNSCLFSVWHTRTVLELLDYVRSTQTTATPLRVTGFDVQASGVNFDERGSQLRAMFRKISSDRADSVFAIESDYRGLARAALGASSASDAVMVTLRDAIPQIRADYQLIADELEASLSVVTADGEFSEREVRIAVQYARTSPDWADQITQQFSLGRGYAERDRGMASNLIALSETVYSNEKVIVWAHNAHLRHQGTGLVPDANMGAIVHRTLEDQMYTIGFYMYRGQHDFPDGARRTIAPPLDNSLEAIFYSRRLSWLFLDLENAPRSAGGAWIDLPTPTWAWGEIELPLVLSAEYDGLLIIDNVTPPNFL
ncbi:MAG: erythromycin esterase family protein [Pseudomonadota bacterium]